MKQIDFEGQTHEFPDDFTDADVAKALGSAKPPETPPESTVGKVARIAGEELVKTPGRMVEGVKSAVGEVANPKLSTVLPLIVGPSSTVATRLGSIAAGKMLEQPSTDPMENLATAARGVVGDWRRPLSMILSPATMETLFPFAGKAFRSTAYGARKVAEDDASRVGAAMGEVAPTLKPGTTAPAMQQTAEGQGLTRIGAGKEAAVQDI